MRTADNLTHQVSILAVPWRDLQLGAPSGLRAEGTVRRVEFQLGEVLPNLDSSGLHPHTLLTGEDEERRSLGASK